MDMQHLACCGIKEISGLSWYKTPEEALRGFAQVTYNRRKSKATRTPEGEIVNTQVPDPFDKFRYVIFSQANVPRMKDHPDRSRYGERLAELITNQKLGTLMDTGSNINPNSGNSLRVWIWTIDHDRTRTFISNLDKPNLANPLGLGGR